MAYVEKKDLKSLNNQSITEAHIWREGYPAFERLADNDLMDGLDPNLPEVNDGSLAASLFKLPKRVYKPMTGTVKTVDRDEAWLAELANMQWQNEIIPNAITQAPFDRKWKDSIRKVAIYGSVPLITISVERNGETFTDFIVAQPQDVRLEPGKVSDYDSDIMFWDVYYTKTQLKSMIEQAVKEQKEAKESGDEGYNTWDIPALRKILASGDTEERSSLDTPRQEQNKDVRPKGFKFCITVQRGKDAPFYMYHSDTDSTVREWSNPDPTGDVPIHFLYCYQDFINPYGIGIVKLAGGTQNVLDYMRQADVLATQLGLRPPINIQGETDGLDIDSLVYAQDALWFTGSAVVKREELANEVYSQLPGRIQMYKTSLNQIIPTGDTSATASESGDPTQSKTPAGVKLVAANLSIDDEDFKDNLYVTYAAVAKSMINTHFANMEGTDLMKLSDEEREVLIKGGMEFPKDEKGQMSNEMEIVWDTVRSKFNFEVDPEQDKAADDADKLKGLQAVAELISADPTAIQEMEANGKKFNKGELYADMIALSSDNDKIITDISPDEKEQQEQQPQVDPNAQPQEPPKTIAESIRWTPADLTPSERAQVLEQGGIQADTQGITPNEEAQDHSQTLDAVNATQSAQEQQHGQTMDMANAPQPEASQEQATDQGAEQPQEEQEPTHGGVGQSEIQGNVDAVMQEFGVDEQTALTALAAEAQGLPAEDVIAHLKSLSQEQPV